MQQDQGTNEDKVEGLPVKGYKPQDKWAIEAVNHNKEIEEVLLRVLDRLKQHPKIDQRWLAIGRTDLEKGFMAINRAIFQPGRVELANEGPAAALASHDDLQA
jgi:hypothetical protein